MEVEQAEVIDTFLPLESEYSECRIQSKKS